MPKARNFVDGRFSKHVRALHRRKAMKDKRTYHTTLYVLGVLNPVMFALLLETSFLIANPFALNTPPVRKHKPIYRVARDMRPNEFVRQFVLPCYADVDRLRAALGIPDIVHFGSRCVSTGIDILLVALRRFSHRDGWEDARLVHPFNTPGSKWSASKFSEAFTWLLDFLDRRFGSLVMWSNAVLNIGRSREAVRCMKAKGSLTPGCAALMDCTLHKVARPVRGQEAAFTGWKKIHFNK